SFEAARAASLSTWNSTLSRIAVAGRRADDLDTFYTSLYRSFLHPNTFNDADGRYIGFDGFIHTVAGGHSHYTNFSDWDTYRGLAALQGLLFPEQASDMAQSLVDDAEQSGSYPRWALANSTTGEMSGDNVVPLIVNLYAYGAHDFDLKTALHYMVNAATKGGVGLNGYVERPGIDTYLRLGYAPQTAAFGVGASITLEWSVDDFAISRFADSLGDSATAAEFQKRAQYWQNLFNPSTRYISPRGPTGSFAAGPGFVESRTGFGQEGFDEGNAEQYLWWVPHNVAGLVTALGGRKVAAGRLDRFTKKLNVGPNEPYLWAGNEPGFGVPWLYNYIGQPWKAQLTVDRVRGLFGPTPDGEPGNDDLGALSSWYVWAALGLYPSTPGTPILTVNAPLFDRAVITLPGGKSIHISARGASAPQRLKYIDGLSVDGNATDRTSLPESIIQTGGDLKFSLSTYPNTVWGTAQSSAPPSFGAGSSAVAVNASRPIVTIAPGATGTVKIDAQRMIDDAGGYNTSATSSVNGITAAPVSGQFASDGSAAIAVEITVARSTPANYYYLVYLTTTVGETARRSTVFVIAATETDEP
ncbi:MAG TPA: GH92 family glycosyl hydrolase, partial [Mycobacterium sp.]|nr:GH92 family glycosyl hydrolase [Mycobacterium sp.]